MKVGDLVFYRHDGRTTDIIGVITAVMTCTSRGTHTVFVRYPSGDGYDGWTHSTRLEAL